MSRAYPPLEPLADDHDLTAFRCRSSEQTHWLQRYARQSAATGTTRVFVVTERPGRRVVAYYAWCMAQIHSHSAPAKLRAGAGRYPQPVAPLARLAVDIDHEGRGLAVGMLQDIFTRVIGLSDDIGCRGLIMHAESAQARDFSLHVIPEFQPSPPTTYTSYCS